MKKGKELGFGGLTTIIGVSMIIYLGWNPGWFHVEKINVKEDSESLMKKDIIFDSPFVSVAADSLIIFYSTNL